MSDLKWSKNTDYLVKKANARMELLRKMFGFSPPVKDLFHIYITYIRSILEQSCVLWHSALTEEDSNNLERVQKNACRNILKERYISYENAISVLQIPTLVQRREILLYNFGRKCLFLEQTKHLFPLNPNSHDMIHRNTEKFSVIHAKTERLRKSTIPYIQRVLNDKHNENRRKQSDG